MTRKMSIQWLAILLAALLLSAGAMGESGAALVQVTRVECDGAVVGRCALPAEYTVSSQVSYCGAGQSLSYPIQLEISGISPAGTGYLPMLPLRRMCNIWTTP